jgi:hypothetical protein
MKRPVFIDSLLFVGRVCEACCPHWVLMPRAVDGWKHEIGHETARCRWFVPWFTQTESVAELDFLFLELAKYFNAGKWPYILTSVMFVHWVHWFWRESEHGMALWSVSPTDNTLKWQCLFRHCQKHPVDCIRHYVITVVVTLDCYVPLRNVTLTAGTSMCIAHCADMTRAAWQIRLSECHV